ncbi:uncharacterized protein LOC122086974 [Macadamia integrifolia]|uniref:uncharacterized protein LOC122086974 n=1 Tax=Macadamia integrifolia TaxID=60698 RepID=UPI001C4E7B10|nr:uncharacterized protein LOC122086974 [Macadamia integrifolia]XP_042511841.1 uncharacterized protein LOC122086974 [Macadamia integrifolia]
MGKQLHHKCSSLAFEDRNRGCMSNVFHILDFHQWHNVKKMLPYKRHGAGRHSGGLKYAKMDQNIPNTIEAQESMDAEVNKLLIQEKMTVSSPTNKKSSNAHIKTLIAEEMSKEYDHKCQTSALPAQLQLLRTDSFHHLEPSNDGCCEDMRVNGESPRIDPNQYNASSVASKLVPDMLKPPETDFCSEQCEVCGIMRAVKSFGDIQVDELVMQLIENHSHLQDMLDMGMPKKHMDAKDLIREALFPQSKEFPDVMEISQVNKELFLKILQDPDSSLVNQFQNIQISSAKRELTKSGSFPVAYLSCRNNVRSSKLKHKLSEIGSFTKREGQLQAGSSPAKLPTADSSDDTFTQPFPLMTDGNKQERMGTAEPGNVSGYYELKNQGDRRVVTNRLKNFKRRIKHAIRGTGKERHRISMDAIFHRIPYGRKHSKDEKKDMSDHWKELTTDRDCKGSPSSYRSESPVYALGKGGLHRLRRTASLNESLHRYSQLFESTFSREAKQHLSYRLKLTNEDAGSLGGPAPKALGRILSLPELKSFCSLQTEVSHDTSCLGMPNRTHMDSPANMERSSQKLAVLSVGTENDSELEASVENASQEILVELSEISLIQVDQVELILNADDDGKEDKTIDNSDNQTTLENISISHYLQEVEPAPDACIKQALPSPNSVLDSDNSEYIITEEADSGLKPRPIDFNELDSLVNLQDPSSKDSPSVNRSTMEIVNVKSLSKYFDSDLPHVQVDKKDESNFNYVREVLELSGFSGNGNLGTWHLPDQPVDPSLFELDCSREETGSSFDHRLLFDVINDVLIDIYERSFMYWPRPLSIDLNIRPMPAGCHVVEEVWASISWFLSYQPELDQSLDYIVARDLAKADGWMSLQFECECVGLELEEWIWDELLEEVMLELEGT